MSILGHYRQQIEHCQVSVLTNHGSINTFLHIESEQSKPLSSTHQYRIFKFQHINSLKIGFLRSYLGILANIFEITQCIEKNFSGY